MSADGPLAEYEALVQAAGLVDFSSRTQVELTGDDRAAFLHNLTTNEIRKLAPGAGCETFLLDSHGKILAHVFVFAGEESHVLETVPDQGQFLVEHLDRFLMREKVELTDRSGDWGELYLAGPQADDLLKSWGVRSSPSQRLDWVLGAIADVPTTIRRIDLTQPGGFLISMPRASTAAVSEAIGRAGATNVGSEAFEMARIEAGTPLFGRDITSENLPQEVARDALAISFVKGCYLGQETVARIDALGHVNRTLVGVRFSGSEVPPPGTTLSDGTRDVGRVTSAAFSPRLDSPLALAYVRRGSNVPGTQLTCDRGAAEVVPLPIVDRR